MKKLIVHEHAEEEELLHEVAYYETKSNQLGIELLSEVERVFQLIRAQPERWQIAKYRTRQIHLDRFPHTIFYRDLEDIIWIVAIAPQKRRPFYWRYHTKNNPSTQQ